MSKEFETDSNGNIVAKPVIGWTTARVAGMSVILAIRYIWTLEEIETCGKTLQLVLRPQQCLEAVARARFNRAEQVPFKTAASAAEG